MLLKCFKFFYIKDNSVGNSVDFNEKNTKLVCDLTFRGREEREKENILQNCIEKKNEMI